MCLRGSKGEEGGEITPLEKTSKWESLKHRPNFLATLQFPWTTNTDIYYYCITLGVFDYGRSDHRGHRDFKWNTRSRIDRCTCRGQNDRTPMPHHDIHDIVFSSDIHISGTYQNCFMLEYYTNAYIYSTTSLNRPPPQIDHSHISIDLFGSKMIHCNYILTP